MYSKDLIERIVAYKESGHTFDEMRAVFAISLRAYYEGKQRLESGYYDKKKEVKERKRKIDKEVLKKAVAEKPDAYLKEYAQIFNCSVPSIYECLVKMGYTYKKKGYVLGKR